MLRIGLIGATGKMGKEILQICESQEDMIIQQQYHSGKSPFSMQNCRLQDINTLEDTINDLDVLIDFSSPSITQKVLEIACKAQCPIVIGTTGFSKEIESLIQNSSMQIPIIWEANFSIGIHVLNILLENASELLPGYFDIELIDRHHRHKKDAPSGTAKMLADTIHEKRLSPIPISSIRAGEIIGEHEILFAGIGENISLIHRAESRATFAKGALMAAKFLAEQKEARRYRFREILYPSC